MLMMMTLTGTRKLTITATGFIKFEMSLQTLLKVKVSLIHLSISF